MPDPLTPDEFHDLVARARLHPSAAVQLASAVDDLLAERARLQARLDDAHSVIRHFDGGCWWDDTPDGPTWFAFDDVSFPVSTAEADAITRARDRDAS